MNECHAYKPLIEPVFVLMSGRCNSDGIPPPSTVFVSPSKFTGVASPTLTTAMSLAGMFVRATTKSDDAEDVHDDGATERGLE